MPTSDTARTSATRRAARADLVARLCERAWQRIPNITDRLKAAGFEPGRWPGAESLRRVALLPKESIASIQAMDPPFGGLRGPGMRRPRSLFCSPGQLFEPDMPSAAARLGRLLRARGFDAGDVVLNGFNYHMTPAGMLFHEALAGIGCTVIPAGPHNTDALVDILVRSRATAYVGIAAHLKLVLDRFLELGHGPQQLHLRKAMAGGEPGAEKTRMAIRQAHDIDAFDAYGTAEVGIIAVEGRDRPGLAVDHEVIVEVVDPITCECVESGCEGQVVLTVDDPDYPMLRLGTGDLGRVDGADGEERLFLLGRVGASARVRGMLLHEAQVRSCLDAHPAIEALQVRIERHGARDEVTGVLQAAPDAFAQASSALSARFAGLCRLRLDRVEAAGKPIDGALLIDDRRQYDTHPES